MSTTTTIYVDDDASLRESHPTTNFGNPNILRTGQLSGSRSHGVFHFDISSFTVPSDIVNANFTLSTQVISGATRTMKIASLNEDFVEAEVTWSIASTGVDWTGGAGAEGNAEFTEPTYDFTVGADTGEQAVDIRELFVDAINRRDSDLWLVLCFDPADSSTTEGFSVIGGSRQSTVAFRPKILVTVAERVEWEGDVDGDLDNVSNWSTGAIPTSTDYALFNTGNADVNDGDMICDRFYVGRNYKGNIGTESSQRRIECNEGHFSSPHAGIFINLINTAPKVYINDTSSTSDSFLLHASLASVIINRTRQDVTIKTTDATIIDAHGGGVFTCDDEVATVRITGSFATLDDIPTDIIIAQRGFAEISRVTNDNNSVTMASNSSMKCLSATVGDITLYEGARITFMGNEGAPIECGEVAIYNGSILDTRTGSPTWTTTAEILVRGGRVLMDGSRAVTIA